MTSFSEVQPIRLSALGITEKLLRSIQERGLPTTCVAQLLNRPKADARIPTRPKKKRQVMQLCKSKTMAFILEATVPHIGTSLVAQKGRIGERRLEKILQSAVSWERNARLPVNAPLCPHHCHTAPQGLANLAAKHFLFKRTGNSHVISLLDTPLVHSG